MTSLTHNGRGRERHLSYFVKPPIQPASCRNSSLSATLAGRVNFAALLLCLVFVIVSHSHAPSAAFRLVLGSCVMRVPTRQSITSAKDLCIVRSVDYPRLSVVARHKLPHRQLSCWTPKRRDGGPFSGTGSRFGAE